MVRDRDNGSRPECLEFEFPGLAIYIVKIKLFKPLDVDDVNKIFKDFMNENGFAIVLGIPLGVNIDPCEVVQAFMYSTEDKIMGKNRIKKQVLAVLSYLMAETQIHKFIDIFKMFNEIYVVSISKEDIKRFCDKFKKGTCSIESLHKLVKYRVNNVI